MGVMEIKDLVTGARLDTNKGASEKGWSGEEVEEKKILFSNPLRILVWMNKSEHEGKCHYHQGATVMPMGSHSYDLMDQQPSCGGLDDIFKVTF